VILKAPVIAVFVLAVALVGIPAVIGGNADSSTAICGELGAILDTIRTIESGGDYTIATNQGGASGAYQYIASTWNNYQGYPSAYLAPPEVQDARAANDVQEILATYGDVAFVPIIWYWPAAATDPLQLDIVPYPKSGNQLTVREYQQHWLAVFASKSAGDSNPGCDGTMPTEAGYVLPIDRSLIDDHPSMIGEPHHDYPAIDLLVPIGSAVYAAHAGTVARVVNWPFNCYQVGRCDQTCGVGVSIDGDDGVRYIYCHGSRLNGLVVGSTVSAGQTLMWSGNTGRSGAPHVHFEIRIDGQQRCPQEFLRSLYNRGAAIAPHVLASSGCSF
jgi:Peptidase family M23/Transglycosylase-like domain